MTAVFEFDSIYLIYFLVGVSAAMLVEGIYLLCFSTSSYRKNINRRLQLTGDKTNRESVLIELRRERGLTSGGEYLLPVVAINRLVLQSGVTMGISKLVMLVATSGIVAFGVTMMLRDDLTQALIAGVLFLTLIPYLVLRFKRGRRQKKFSAQFPDALDVIVRSLRAGHPVPIAIGMVAREMPDPIGTEFGIVADEITYGSDLEAAMRNLYFRIGSDDLPLFVTAVAIQTSTGGNLGEILENLSSVIRMRFKMRRKIRALAAEGRASAMILSALPIGMFGVLQVIAPGFYSSVWDESITKIVLATAGSWMLIGIFIMFRMVNFKI